MKAHSLSAQQEIADLDPQGLWYGIREETEGMDFSECKGGFEFATYPHLIQGMDAGYYAYLWYVKCSLPILQLKCILCGEIYP